MSQYNSISVLVENGIEFDKSNVIHLRGYAAYAVALGDFSKLDLKMIVNFMVAQLSSLANEVTRVSPEGGQAFVSEVQGMWRVLFSRSYY